MSEPIKVLSVIHPFRPEFSGAGEWWLRMIPRLRERDVDVEILTSKNGAPADAPERETIEGTVVHRLRDEPCQPSYASWMRRILRAVGRRRRDFQALMFFGPNYDAAYAGCLLGRFLGWRTVFRMTLLYSDDLRTIRATGKLGRLRFLSLRLADGLIGASRRLSRGYDDDAGISRKLLIAPQGVDTRRYRPDAERRRRARAELGIDPDTRVTLFCGAVVPRKGVDTLVDAWARVRHQVENSLLLVVGPNHRDGFPEPEYQSFAESVARRVAELNLTSSVRMLGLRRDVERFYAASDVFVLPSRAEGWGNVLSEAMACGLPIVVSHLDGIAEEQLTHGREGVIVRSHDPDVYADHLTDLLENEEKAARMARAARARAVEKLDIERCADLYAGFLRRVATGSVATNGVPR